MALDKFYDEYGVTTEKTAEIIQKVQRYVDLALELGDIAYQDKPAEVTIKIRIPKKDTK